MVEKKSDKPEIKRVSDFVNLSNFKSDDRVCRDHGAYTAHMMPNQQWSNCPHCQHEETARQDGATFAQERKELQKNDSSERMRALRIQANIPPRFRDRTLEEFEAPSREQQLCLKICEKYLAEFDDRFKYGGGLTLLGRPGTGKTHLAASIGNSLLEQGRTVLFVDVYDLIDGIKDVAFDKKECSELEARNRYTGFDLLILDEVGAQLGSDWEKATLFKVINDRYKAQLPTILISNLAEPQFEQYVGDRVVDRMKEGGGATLKFTWDSYRSNRFRKDLGGAA